jgi:HEAT repeat protein
MRKSLTHDQAYDAIERIVEARHTSSDLDDIIGYLRSASDISPLTRLLNSAYEHSVRDGVYILSELGRAGIPLREVARSLLDHTDYRIRYWAMNAVVSCFESNAAIDAIAAAGLLNDADEFVRTRAGEMIAALRKPNPRQ